MKIEPCHFKPVIYKWAANSGMPAGFAKKWRSPVFKVYDVFAAPWWHWRRWYPWKLHDRLFNREIK